MLFFGCGGAVRGETVIVAYVVWVFSIHCVVTAGASEAPVLRLLKEGRLKLPSLLDAVRNFLVESSIMACCRVDAPLWVELMNTFVAPPRGEAQAAKVVSDELEVPKVNSFFEGESTACQTLAIGDDGDCRWWNHRND
jgi:hypothetical protein